MSDLYPTKEEVFEVFSRAGTLIQHAEDAGSADRSFDINSYFQASAAFVALAPVVRKMARKMLMDLPEAKAPIKPREEP